MRFPLLLAAFASLLIPACAQIEARDPRTPGVMTGLAFMAGSRISIGGTVAAYVPDNGSLAGAAVVEAARSGADAIFLLGDMISNSAPDNSEGEILARALRRSPVQICALPGACESNPPVPGMGFTKEGFLDFMAQRGYSPAEFPAAVEVENCVAVFIFDAVKPASKRGELSGKDIEWLLEKSASLKAMFRIAVIYNPAALPENASSFSENLLLNAADAEEAFRKAGVSVAVSASIGAPFCVERGGVLFIGLGDLVKFPNTYLFAEADEDGALTLEFRTAADGGRMETSKRLLQNDPPAKILADEFPAGWRVRVAKPPAGKGGANGGK
jgi:hypothetical protein